MTKVEVTDIEWDAPKSVIGDLPNSFVFHIDENEGVDFDCEEAIRNGWLKGNEIKTPIDGGKPTSKPDVPTLLVKNIYDLLKMNRKSNKIVSRRRRTS